MPPNKEVQICAEGKFGYDVELCNEVNGRFHCPLCHLLMRKPVQTIRGELACESCYKEAYRGNRLCPIDNEPLEADEHQIFADIFKTREILNLNCYCCNKSYGCPWKGTIGEVEDHQKNCDYKAIQCDYCHVYVTPRDMFTHLNICERFSAEGKCLYEGCFFKPTNTTDLKQHLEINVIAHTILHKTTISNFQIKMNSRLQIQHEQNKEKETYMENEIKLLKEQFNVFVESMTKTQMNNEKMMNNLQNKLHKLENSSLPSTNQSCELVPKDYKTPVVENLSNKVNVMNQNISDLTLRQQLFENTCYDGKIIWKIDNVSKRLNQATNGKVTALHSAPTFTMRYGYKFCGRLYLNGDGVGRNTHVSLFIVLMKSEYDNLLTWPFNRIITLRLINQTDTREEVKESFHSDIRSTSFTQPKKEMNVASGCPLFITKERFLNGGFIKDDTVFIEITTTQR